MIILKSYKSVFNEEKIEELSDYNKSKIKIYYPNTDYIKVNKKIKKIIYNYITDYKKGCDEVNTSNYKYYTLYVNYDKYEYDNYLSIVFYIEIYTGGAHPNHFIETINYDKLKDKIIDIQDLYEVDKSILNILSSFSRETLMKSDKYKDSLLFNEGTKPTLENFKNFVFTENGLKIYFNYYQIAPYYYGVSELIIPYDKLNI